MYKRWSVTQNVEIHLFLKCFHAILYIALKTHVPLLRFSETFSMWCRGIFGTKWHRFHYCCNLWWVQPLYAINTLDYRGTGCIAGGLDMMIPCSGWSMGPLSEIFDLILCGAWVRVTVDGAVMSCCGWANPVEWPSGLLDLSLKLHGIVFRLGEQREPGVEHDDIRGLFWGDPRSALLLWGGHSTLLCFSWNSITSWISVACRHNSRVMFEYKSLSVLEMLSGTVGPGFVSSSDRVSMRRRIGRRLVGLKMVFRRLLYP